MGRSGLQSALFNFQSLLLVFLLIICTSAYAHSIMPGIMDRNRHGYGIHRSYLWFPPSNCRWRKGWKRSDRVLTGYFAINRFFGIFWKCARIGERLSPYVCICCILMAVSLFIPITTGPFFVIFDYLISCRSSLLSVAVLMTNECVLCLADFNLLWWLTCRPSSDYNFLVIVISVYIINKITIIWQSMISNMSMYTALYWTIGLKG